MPWRRILFGYLSEYALLDWEFMIIFGIIFIILGTPLLDGQNTPYVLISIIGIEMETIISMAVYILGIERKYRKK